MKTFKLFSMAALALAMAACSSEDSALENAAPAQQQGAMKFTATLAAPGSGATTRTTYTEVTSGDDAGKINVAWKAGDQIYLHDDDYGGTCTATVGTPAADGSATISGTFDDNVEAGDNITAAYPASAAEDLGAFYDKFASQAGTIAYIQDNLDYRIGTSTISVSGDQATLATALQMESQIAIWKLTLQDNAATPAALSATKVTIKKGSDVIAATTDITATSAVYLALNLASVDISGADITIEATVGSDTYTYSKSGVSLAKGNYYQSTLKMTKPAVTLPTLAQTMTTTGMTVKVKYNYNNEENYCLFSSNGDGTYTFQSGDGWVGVDAGYAKALVVEGGKLVFKQNYYDTIDDQWSDYGFSATFDTSNNSYILFVGPLGQESFNPSFISVEVNSVPIALTQIFTVADLVKEDGDSWSDIIDKNSDKIKSDGYHVVRISDNAKLQCHVTRDVWQYVDTDDKYKSRDTYKFEGE